MHTFFLVLVSSERRFKILKYHSISDVEFTSPGRGLKRMRSDDEKIGNIRTVIDKDISVKCSSVDKYLLDAITEPFLAVKPENVKTTRVLNSDDETSSDDLVTLIATTEKVRTLFITMLQINCSNFVTAFIDNNDFLNNI